MGKAKTLLEPGTRFEFTRTLLRDGLQVPSSGWVYFYDELERGLALGVGATGAKTFRVLRLFQGRTTRVTLGSFDPAMPDTHDLPRGVDPLDLLCNAPALNVLKARKLARAVNASLDKGVNPAERIRGQRKKENEELTLGELFKLYHADRTQSGTKTVDGLVWNWERYVGQLPDDEPKKHARKRTKAPGSVNWERRRISTIHREEVARLRSALASNISPASSNKVMELLCAMYNFAIEQGLFTNANPAHFAKYPTHGREDRIESHQAQKFFAKLNAEEEDFRDYVYLSICTGARRGNMLRMRWDELALTGAIPHWTLTGEQMKNGDPLTIALIPDAVAILERRAQSANGSDWVFPGSTPEGHAGPFRFQWERLRKEAEVPALRIHDLRRTLGSWMAGTGASTVITMRALGHKSINAALIYQRLELAPVQSAMANGFHGLLKAAEPEAKPTRKASPRSRARSAKAGRE